MREESVSSRKMKRSRDASRVLLHRMRNFMASRHDPFPHKKEFAYWKMRHRKGCWSVVLWWGRAHVSKGWFWNRLVLVQTPRASAGTLSHPPSKHSSWESVQYQHPTSRVARPRNQCVLQLWHSTRLPHTLGWKSDFFFGASAISKSYSAQTTY